MYLADLWKDEVVGRRASDMPKIRPIDGCLLPCVLLGIAGILFSASSASANPAILPDFENGEELFLYLAITNFPIDLFCFSILMLFMCRALGTKVGRISNKTSFFVATVVLASLAIAVSGSLIDFYAFYEKNLYGYSLGWGDEEQLYKSPNLYLALIAIFLSVLLTTVGIVRTTRIVGVYTAVAITAINFFAWMLILGASDSLLRVGTVTLFMVFWILAVIPLCFIGQWHKRLAPEDLTTPRQEQVGA